MSQFAQPKVAARLSLFIVQTVAESISIRERHRKNVNVIML